MAFSSEHPKRDHNQNFTPLLARGRASCPFHMRVPSPAELSQILGEIFYTRGWWNWGEPSLNGIADKGNLLFAKHDTKEKTSISKSNGELFASNLFICQHRHHCFRHWWKGECFPFAQKFRNFCYEEGNYHGKLSENPTVVQFPSDANHSTENSWNFGRKIKWSGNSRKEILNHLVRFRMVVLFSRMSWNYFLPVTGSFRKFTKTKIVFGHMEIVPRLPSFVSYGGTDSGEGAQRKWSCLHLSVERLATEPDQSGLTFSSPAIIPKREPSQELGLVC